MTFIGADSSDEAATVESTSGASVALTAATSASSDRTISPSHGRINVIRARCGSRGDGDGADEWTTTA